MKTVTLNRFSLVAVMLVCTGIVNAQNSWWSIGSPRDTDVKATLSADQKTLTISGKGKMQEFVGGANSLPWNDHRTTITTVTIENGVENIVAHAFSGSSALTTVNIPNSVKSIGDYAFSGCSSLSSVNIPNSVVSIDTAAFFGCKSLTSVMLPARLKNIASSVFAYSGLTSITIPEKVINIEDFAFQNCKGLNFVFNLSSKPQVLTPQAFDNLALKKITLYVADTSVYNRAAIWKDFSVVVIDGLKESDLKFEEVIADQGDQSGLKELKRIAEVSDNSATEGTRCHIIGGSFRISANAMAFVEECILGGFPEAKIIFASDKELYRVSLKSFDNLGDAIGMLIEVKRDKPENKEFWLLVK
ncbi:hypothetical protein FACS1894199_15600 [Bacteroidia bacterium]|nr:hypothetical protein FACS1894199_15600 [Bacteroidia bacterium]